MKTTARSITLVALLALGCVGAVHADPITFHLFVDATDDDTLDPDAFYGGDLILNSDPGDGTFTVSQVGGFSTNFDFGLTAFTNADIASDLNEVRFVLSTDADGRRLQFSDTGSFFGSGGPIGGSIDYINSDDFAISFEPSFFGGNLNRYAFGFGGFIFGVGTYRLSTASVPEPAFYSMSALVTAGGAGLLVRRRRRK